ncbi:acylamino-acid-releasing enzyme [Diretmus argenteus]
MDPANINRIFAECSGLATPVSAGVTDLQLGDQRVYRVTAEWSQTDLVRGSRLGFTQQWNLLVDSNDQKTFTSILPPGPCTPVYGELLSGFSLVRGLRAIVRETSGHQLLEIWDDHGLRKCLDLTALNKHGRVYDDAQFGCLSWSECENRLLYVAERKRNLSTETHEGESACGKDRSLYWEDWGEGLTSKSSPVVCVVNLQSGVVNVLSGVPSHVSPGQALWIPGGSVVFVGWWHEPFRLGLKFCSNRRSALFKVNPDGHCVCLTGDDVSVSCPRLSPDGTALVFLQGRVFGPHNQCLSLQQLDLDSRKTSTLLEVVHRPQTGEFAGLYESLPSCCWSTDGQRIVFSSACRNWKDLFVVDRRTKKVSSLSDSKSPSSPPHLPTSYQSNAVSPSLPPSLHPPLPLIAPPYFLSEQRCQAITPSLHPPLPLIAPPYFLSEQRCQAITPSLPPPLPLIAPPYFLSEQRCQTITPSLPPPLPLIAPPSFLSEQRCQATPPSLPPSSSSSHSTSLLPIRATLSGHHSLPPSSSSSHSTSLLPMRATLSAHHSLPPSSSSSHSTSLLPIRATLSAHHSLPPSLHPPLPLIAPPYFLSEQRCQPITPSLPPSILLFLS